MTEPLRTWTTSEPYVDAAFIASAVFRSAVSPRWVRAHVPGTRVSPRKVLYLESRVRAWLAQREAA